MRVRVDLRAGLSHGIWIRGLLLIYGLNEERKGGKQGGKQRGRKKGRKEGRKNECMGRKGVQSQVENRSLHQITFVRLVTMFDVVLVPVQSSQRSVADPSTHSSILSLKKKYTHIYIYENLQYITQHSIPFQGKGTRGVIILIQRRIRGSNGNCRKVGDIPGNDEDNDTNSNHPQMEFRIQENRFHSPRPGRGGGTFGNLPGTEMLFIYCMFLYMWRRKAHGRRDSYLQFYNDAEKAPPSPVPLAAFSRVRCFA